MGGFIGSAYAIKYPDRIQSLSLVSSSTAPKYSGNYKALIISAYYAFKTPLFAKLFSLIYCSPFLTSVVQKSPLPRPRDNFPTSESYPVFGTLANVLYTTLHSKRDTQIRDLKVIKRAMLFSDDNSFPADTYTKVGETIPFVQFLRRQMLDFFGTARRPYLTWKEELVIPKETP
jgi:pimeloyl-ACP methyl ester carboxylesterase